MVLHMSHADNSNLYTIANMVATSVNQPQGSSIVLDYVYDEIRRFPDNCSLAYYARKITDQWLEDIEAARNPPTEPPNC